MTFEYAEIRTTGLPGGGVQIETLAGVKKTVRIVPPAGDRFAFDVDDWPHRFTVYVSPTGRSVRLWIDGDEIELPKPRPRRRV